LRNAYSRYPVKFQVKKAAARKKRGSKRFEYQCKACEKWYPSTQTEVDHIVGAGKLSDFSDLPGFVERLFCEADNLQVLCKGCHQEKTNRERKEKKK
jgi:5-methylcytosine-specific restriction endonuclease McrA